MKLHIRNFAKIKEANIIVDGITVIAGENNTGKSTVGKILFSMFNALSDIDKKIFDERAKEIEYTTRNILLNYISVKDMPRSVVMRNALNVSRRINLRIREILDENMSLSYAGVREIVEESQNALGSNIAKNIDDMAGIIEEISKNIYEILSLPESTIVLEIISRYFNDVFHSQIKPLANNDDNEAVLCLQIQGNEEKIFFKNNVCKDFLDEVGISHKAIYIDNPFIVDELSKYNNLNPMNELLVSLLQGDTKDGILDGIIETVRAKEKLSEIYDLLKNVVDGEIILNQNDEFYLKMDGLDEPISLENLSTGMKSFVILKRLLEKGCLKIKDVVILDEPEIHLHPQWQIAYAELIVLIQKHFDLSVVVTTHSPYFVDAINLFSCKYETNSKVNYYLSSNIDNTVKMDLVSDNIDMIYKKMASPIQMLDTLRYELNNN